MSETKYKLKKQADRLSAIIEAIDTLLENASNDELNENVTLVYREDLELLKKLRNDDKQ